MQSSMKQKYIVKGWILFLSWNVFQRVLTEERAVPAWDGAETSGVSWQERGRSLPELEELHQLSNTKRIKYVKRIYACHFIGVQTCMHVYVCMYI